MGDLTVLLLLAFLLFQVSRCNRRPKPVAPHPVATPGALRGVTVVIDPGHGGSDYGAIQQGICEAQLTYRMAATLTQVLHTAGAEVLFTVHSRTLAYAPKQGQPEPVLERPADARFVIDNKRVGLRRGESPEDLYRRAKLGEGVWKKLGKKGKGKVFFLSIHYDAISEHQYRGGMAYYDKRRTAPKLVQVLARRFGETGLAGQRRGSTPKSRELGVLNPAHNPIPESVLVELATISNTKDLTEARSPAWRWKVAHLLADAIAECR